MRWLFLLLILAGFYPWLKAWHAVRKTSLQHALAWTCVAWSGCGIWLGDSEPNLSARYFALCLFACAGVAVLGARRPHVGAWNFVVAGLLAVMTLPLLQGLMLGERPPEPIRVLFLAAILLVVLGNYLFTSFGPAVILAGASCLGEIWPLLTGQNTSPPVTLAAHLGLALVPWVGWIAWVLRRHPVLELDRNWLDFRDCFGALWSLRAREQFNHAAEHAGWPVVLHWNGLASKNGALNGCPAEMLANFQAVIKRFVDGPNQDQRCMPMPPRLLPPGPPPMPPPPGPPGGI